MSSRTYPLEDLTIDTAKKLAGNPALSQEEWISWLRMWANAEQSRKRKKELQKRIDYYEGRQVEYLAELLDEQFKDAESLGLQLEFTNIVKLIIDRISIIYKWGAKRELFDRREGKEVSSKEKSLWEWIQSSGKFARTMDTVNKMVNLTDTVLLRPWYSQKHDKFNFDILTPVDVDVIPDPEDPTEAASISYSHYDDNAFFHDSVKKRKNQIVYHYWDDSTYLRFNPNGIIPIPGNPDNMNPYGIIPAVRFSSHLPLRGFFIDSGESLVNAQDNINIKLVELNYLLKMQSFSVPVLIGYDPSGSEQIIISPGDPVIIPQADRDEQPAEFRFESPNPNIDALMEEIAQKVQRIARVYGIAASDFKLEGSASSGYALKLQNRHLIDRYKRELPYYEDAEAETFAIVKKVWNYHSQFLPKNHRFRGIRFSENTELSVTINEPTYDDGPKELREEWKFRLENKLATRIDYYMQTMHMSEEAAIAHDERVRKWFSEGSLSSS
ncbi:MAG: phage portal protein [Candidatus Zixiibacteriota bacterium]